MNLEEFKKKVEDENKILHTKVEYEVDEFNNLQNKMYKQVLFGLSSFTKEEISKMSYKQQNEVTKKTKKAQNVLNLWKQTLCNKYVNDLLHQFFPKSRITQELLEDNHTDVSFKNCIDFKILGINKKQIINYLIKQEVLPENFYKLK